METETPEADHEHGKSGERKCCQSPDTAQETKKSWVRDPNIWIAIFTVPAILIAFWALRISQETLRVSQDTEKRQLRAYVAPANMRTSGTDSIIEVEFDVENFGQTPAKNCSVSGAFEILPFPLPEKHLFKIPAAPFSQNSIITPRATKPLTVKVHRTLTAAEKTEIKSKEANSRLYVYGVLNYHDIFNEAHFTDFCSFIIINTNTRPRKDSAGRTLRAISWADCDQHTDFN